MCNQKTCILEIKDLHANIGNVEILKGINLIVNSGEIHAIMGKNGSGKSTLAKVIVGHPSYVITRGDILFENVSILDKQPEERAQIGIFLGFQYPIEIPGVTNADFLRLAYNARQKAKRLKEVEPLEFFELIHAKLDIVKMDSSFLMRNVKLLVHGFDRFLVFIVHSFGAFDGFDFLSIILWMLLLILFFSFITFICIIFIILILTFKYYFFIIFIILFI